MGVLALAQKLQYWLRMWAHYSAEQASVPSACVTRGESQHDCGDPMTRYRTVPIESYFPTWSDGQKLSPLLIELPLLFSMVSIIGLNQKPKKISKKPLLFFWVLFAAFSILTVTDKRKKGEQSWKEPNVSPCQTRRRTPTTRLWASLSFFSLFYLCFLFLFLGVVENPNLALLFHQIGIFSSIFLFFPFHFLSCDIH